MDQASLCGAHQAFQVWTWASARSSLWHSHKPSHPKTHATPEWHQHIHYYIPLSHPLQQHGLQQLESIKESYWLRYPMIVPRASVLGAPARFIFCECEVLVRSSEGTLGIFADTCTQMLTGLYGVITR